MKAIVRLGILLLVAGGANAKAQDSYTEHTSTEISNKNAALNAKTDAKSLSMEAYMLVQCANELLGKGSYEASAEAKALLASAKQIEIAKNNCYSLEATELLASAKQIDITKAEMRSTEAQALIAEATQLNVSQLAEQPTLMASCREDVKKVSCK